MRFAQGCEPWYAVEPTRILRLPAWPLAIMLHTVVASLPFFANTAHSAWLICRVNFSARSTKAGGGPSATSSLSRWASAAARMRALP